MFKTKDKIKFPINEFCGFFLELPYKKSKLSCCDMGLISYYDLRSNNHYILDEQEPVMSCLLSLEGSLTLVFRGEAEFDFIPQVFGLGYLWNEGNHDLVTRLNEGQNLVENEKDLVSSYQVWSSSLHNYSTWLYTNNKKIYFEVTPDYPWHYIEPKLSDPFISYEEFMKTYRPLVLEEISRTVAEQWLVKTQELLEIIHKNSFLHEPLVDAK